MGDGMRSGLANPRVRGGCFARGEKGERKMSAVIENRERERERRREEGWDLVGEPEVFRKTYGARCYQ